jgi:hydroxyethylthiazole kinase
VTPPPASAALSRIRARSPLVHMITNLVSMTACAQLVKAVGASTIFAHDPSEAAAVAATADAVLLNLGTSVPGVQEVAVQVARTCRDHGVPAVLDPVGVAASTHRSEVCRAVLATGGITAVSGNLAELAVLAGLPATMKGADAVSVDATPQQVVTAMAASAGVVAIASGPTDWLGDGRRVHGVFNGHPLMGSVVGTGSARSAVLAAFLAVSDGDLLDTATTATAAYGVAGQIAAAQGHGPGYLLADLHNALSDLDDATVSARAAIRRLPVEVVA